ncbi:GNAT family N-acetyltransferase [Sorangium cellulosum]
MSANRAPAIRRIEDAELSAAFQVVCQLRSHLTEDEFIARVERQRAFGYWIAGAFVEETLLGVIGMREVETLARGRHLHIDDLVVDEHARRTGTGRMLLQFAEEYARSKQLAAVFLDSRTEVIPFYERFGYSAHAALLMRKRL